MAEERLTSLLSPRRWAWDLYGEVVSAVRGIYRVLEPDRLSPASLFWPENVIRKAWMHLREGDSDLISMTVRSTPDHFLFGHVANLTILSLRLGVAVGLEEEDVTLLGLAAFFSELGLARQKDLAAKITKLTEEEYLTLRGHVEEGVKMLDLFPVPEGPRKETLRQILRHCHERAGGAGYPAGLKGEAIHPFARIIGLADSFEAMTHPRPWRSRAMAHDVLRRWVEDNEKDFDPLLIRALVDSLGFFPPGTFVRISSGEVARVMVSMPDMPLRPKLGVFMDVGGKRLARQTLLPLVSRPDLFISEAVDETLLPSVEPGLALELRTQGWWVKGI